MTNPIGMRVIEAMKQEGIARVDASGVAHIGHVTIERLASLIERETGVNEKQEALKETLEMYATTVAALGGFRKDSPALQQYSKACEVLQKYSPK